MNKNRAATTTLGTVRGYNMSNADSVNSVLMQLEIPNTSAQDPLITSQASSNEEINKSDQ